MTKLNVASLTIGDELLDGRIVDTNAQRLGRALFERGAQCSEIRTVPDEREHIISALHELTRKADVVVTSGGLGPTTDDLTAECVAEAAGVPVELHAPTWAKIEALFSARNFPLTENNKRQALLPQGATVFDNAVGLCPCSKVMVNETPVYMLPGVPREYTYLLENHVLGDMLAERNGARVHRTVRTIGMSESEIGRFVSALPEASAPGVRVQYRASFPENHVRFIVERASEDEAATLANLLAEKTAAGAGSAAYAVGEDDLATLVIAKLRDRGETLALAESCTGGLIGKEIVDVSGASAAFVGGVISYANRAKTAMLGVDADLIVAEGAVSEPVARAMAAGAKERLGATYALSVTGIAGPDGGTEEKPVGTVCFGLATPAGVTVKTRRLPNMGRDRVRLMATRVALLLLHRELEAS